MSALEQYAPTQTQMDSSEGGMGKPGFSDRSYGRGHFLALSNRSPESLRQAYQDENLSGPHRRVQVKASLELSNDETLPLTIGAPSMEGSASLEGSIPLAAVHPELRDNFHFAWYGQVNPSLAELRVEEHQPRLGRRLTIAQEMTAANDQAPDFQQRLVEQINAGQLTPVNDIADHQRPDANRLWFDSFEWTPEAIDDLLAEARTPGSGVYISGIENQAGQLISLCFAMEQRMTLEVNGHPIDVSFFELTDLITDPNRRESGAGSACTLNLMHQIARDYENPIFIAEGNVAAGTHRLLGRLGFTSQLDQDGAVRLLPDHVAVGDDLSYFSPEFLAEIEAARLSGELAPALLALGDNLTRLRDFLVMYLPSSGLAELRQNVFNQLP